jgi:DNA-binding response OmpR family regulator
MKVLVIDDDQLVRYTLSKILHRNGYDVVTASDGMRAMAVFHEERPDVVITDILRMAEAFGADDVIPKPFEAEELLSRLARFDFQAPVSG